MKNRGDEPVGVMIHIYMEISQGNSLCCYLYLKQAKMLCFLFFFYKISEQEGGTSPGGGTNGRERWQG
jgi:hypothetical protein